MDLNKAVASFIGLRDKIAALEKDHKAKLKQIKDIQAKLQTFIQGELDKVGADNVKTPSGTAFKAKKDSVRVVNKAEFMDFIKSQVDDNGVDGLYMLTISASKNAVKEFMDDHEDELPPGIKYEQWQEVQIRSN